MTSPTQKTMAFDELDLQNHSDRILFRYSEYMDNHRSERKYYVYVYLDEDMQPYYVGKGSKNRINEPHGTLALPPRKYRKKVLENLSEYDALDLESELINHLGRKIDGGILENIYPGTFYGGR